MYRSCIFGLLAGSIGLIGVTKAASQRTCRPALAGWMPGAIPPVARSTSPLGWSPDRRRHRRYARFGHGGSRHVPKITRSDFQCFDAQRNIRRPAALHSFGHQG